LFLLAATIKEFVKRDLFLFVVFWSVVVINFNNGISAANNCGDEDVLDLQERLRDPDEDSLIERVQNTMGVNNVGKVDAKQHDAKPKALEFKIGKVLAAPAGMGCGRNPQ